MILRQLFFLALAALFLVALNIRATAADGAPSLAGVYRVSGTNEKGESYHGMAAVIQNGTNYAFRWWVGPQTFAGIGHFEDAQLVVNWGDKAPVIYRQESGGVLNGTWADGRATERLTRYAGGTSTPLMVRLGSYSVEGTDQEGKFYKGGASITRVDDRYIFEWSIGEAPNMGEGEIVGNLLIVKWDDPQPVIYAAGPNGSLMGLWASGIGDETLTPMP